MIGRLARVFAASFCLLIFGGSAEAQSLVKAPSLMLRNLQGRTLRLADYKGKIVLINFWATWCPPCRTEIPELIRWQREYRARGLRIIGITYPPQKLSEVRAFARSLKVNYPLALGNKTTKLRFTSSATLPLTVVIDREGRITETIEGIIFPEEFNQKIRPLL